jgi:hypothetical protein
MLCNDLSAFIKLTGAFFGFDWFICDAFLQ